MHVLWLVNMPLPEASLLMNEKPVPFGGWLLSQAKDLSGQTGFELSIAFPRENIRRKLQGKNIKYYVFPAESGYKASELEKFSLKNILDEAEPDIVHIFGTEYSHSLAMVNACARKGIRTVISIQGLVSVYAVHYTAGLPYRIQKRLTLRDFLKRSNILQQQRKFIRRGLLEIEALKKTKHVIGRTCWDKACASQINPEAEYHFCNETLREEFYKNEWKFGQCEKYSMFMSQAAYPVKGLHYMLEAMPLILKRFPESKLYVAGPEIIKSDTIKQRFKRKSYAKYIIELVKKYSLEGNVVFTGLLDEKQMCERYLKSHVFVSPSSIENSSNSLCEAMMLGLPCAASFVGGIPDLVKHGEEGLLYQHDAPYMLAHHVCEVFASDELALRLSANARARALKTHDRHRNLSRLLEIYNKIISDKA